jgi:hypothetical protein
VPVAVDRQQPGAGELPGALLCEQNDEWLVQRRYLSVESMALILADPAAPERQVEQEVPSLTAA